MNDKQYNIFSELRENISDFDQEGIYIVGKPTPQDKFNKDRRGEKGGYYYSQRDLNEAIDLAIASKYSKGLKDKDGKRKTFINIVNFYRDVALMRVGVNVSNYILEPVNSENSWPVMFMDKKFKEWSDENSYDDTIDELADEFVTRGSCVAKMVRGDIERVPLRTLRCSQGAKSLEHAASNGGYVLVENELHYTEMKNYPGWNLEDLDKTKTYCVFERYSLVPQAVINQSKGKAVKDEDWENMVLAVQVLLPDEKTLKGKKGEEHGKIVFLETIAGDFPLQEAHYSKIDGRWQGVGEVEKQLENQIARNLTANLRRRGFSWAVKKMYQSTDEDVKKNLAMEVEDGEVLYVKPNGLLTEVNTQSQHLPDFGADENNWKENSQQIAFAFESATGESMPSGTPFRLGAMLDAAVSKHFKLKQDTFSNFLKRSFFKQILPTFRNDMTDEHSLMYQVSDENYDQVREAMIVLKTNEIVHKDWMNRIFTTFEEARVKVEDDMNRHPKLFVDMMKDAYKDPQCIMRLNINEPIAADVETLTTLYTAMSQKGDPRADKVLAAILAKKGQNLDAIVGPMPKPVTPPGQDPNAPAMPGPNGMATPSPAMPNMMAKPKQ